MLPSRRALPRSKLQGLGVPWQAVALAVTLQAHAVAAEPAAQPAAPDAPQSRVEGAGSIPEVTIEARRKSLESGVKAFVKQLTHSSRFSSESVPRWRDALCFMVAGLPRGEGSFVAARLSQVAAVAGAKVRAKGCARSDVNFYVVFTPDPARTLKYLNGHPALLFHSDASRQQINQFLDPSDPGVVRIWHNAALTGADGQPLVAGTASCASMPGMLVNCTANGGSRLSVQAIEQFTTALVVIDSRRLDGATVGQITDYVAMAGLADFALNDNFGDAPTILRLFSQPPAMRPKELTPWDRAFLSALDHTDQRSVTQREHIADNILRELTN